MLLLTCSYEFLWFIDVDTPDSISILHRLYLKITIGTLTVEWISDLQGLIYNYKYLECDKL